MMAVMGLPARERERRWCIDCHAELGGPGDVFQVKWVQQFVFRQLTNEYCKGPSIKYVRRFSGFLDPLPPPLVHILARLVRLNSRNLPYYRVSGSPEQF